MNMLHFFRASRKVKRSTDLVPTSHKTKQRAGFRKGWGKSFPKVVHSVFTPLLSLFLMAFVLFSCEEVIELDLDTAEEQLVIEATLNATDQVASVFLTRSNGFYDNALPTTISDATVLLSDAAGNTYSLAENSPGQYFAEQIEANPGDVFSVSITIEGQVYESFSEVPVPVSLEEIAIIENGGPPFPNDNDGDISLSILWNDPVGITNYYRVRSYIDGVFRANETYMVFTEEIIGDGKEFDLPVRDRFDEETMVEIELLSTSEAYYDYFLQVSMTVDSGGPGGGATPFNPSGNFGPGVLGYFGIYQTSRLSISL